MKFSKQRELILNEILNNPVHPTADCLYENLKKDNPSLSLGTVYRNLAQLTEHGFIKKVSIPGNPDRFDGRTENHYHIICEVCGEVYDLESEILSNLKESISEETDIKITSYNISFKGICNNCRKCSQVG
ncbi:MULTISPECIES: Fur family transcriptional regulator [unclassified Clostridioides]|uniref:Fur family transcriptional regulator n=1 Tax=unclassified Clostridioides TaxID=2635829 RepID=UPI001D126A53|nr:transcriptional repressor [Clostridioides sp. ZZV15-6388]MCC0644753.1 transcriptional repressor [Clostridioides sp. ZZV14-6150]MCC0647333.1 transcriptional repressor [Clostridioides sp. ZZV15-6598]MCC0661517.1 transcriptional repressor [Clostridioides sp. ZZV14-6154]MCC0665251.1 transcriptional repressor [Clostridioides sp. ZZV15-6597]MCC0668603.1 transcriptional repressor [Clostridioides sp. ZZV14-6153]MCC0717857.1 transcriptional repressor [Clostridioides sp. ZZV14-6105]MCC0722057.1 tra